MNLLDKLTVLMEKTGDSIASLARKSGIPATTIYGLYQKGYDNMKLSTLISLCNYFGVSLDYLAKDNYADTPALSDPDEEKLVELYRCLNNRGQQTMMDVAVSLASMPNMKKVGTLNDTTTA